MEGRNAMNAYLLIQMCREQAGLPDTWDWCRLACMPVGGERTLYYELEGGIAPLKTRGKYKGRKDWKKATHLQTFHVTPAEYSAWEKTWVERTGNCPNCTGEGKTVARISVTEGTTYRECYQCKGTGKHETETLGRTAVPAG